MTDDVGPNPLTIEAVRLVEESYRSYRDLDEDGNPDLYPVMVFFNRRIDAFEQKELKEFGIVMNDDNPLNAIVWNTTLEQVRDDRYRKALASAVATAHEKRRAAAAEDMRLEILAQEINLDLRRQREQRAESGE